MGAGAYRGLGRLGVDAVLGLAGVVEAMHAAIVRWPGTGREGKTRGLTGLVYASVRATARIAGQGMELVLRGVGEDGKATPSLREEAVRAALNGVVGDHLARSGNPLAIEMRLRRAGRPLALEPAALASALPDLGGRPLVLVHGSCLSDLAWRRQGHDHGAALARDLGHTPLYLHYDSGLHVAANGRALAKLLETLVAAWPVPIERLTLLGHSMGGLVVRSACAHAAATGLTWPGRVSDIVFLGTPHQGAPLERVGSFVQAALGVSRYSAPLERLARLRSAGVTDLRHGTVLEESAPGRDRFAPGHPRPRPVPLPAGVRCFAVAGVGTRLEEGVAARLLGDGLVPLDSALGRHREPSRDLGFPAARQFVATGTGHLELLSSPEVYRRVRAWLEG